MGERRGEEGRRQVVKSLVNHKDDLTELFKVPWLLFRYNYREARWNQGQEAVVISKIRDFGSLRQSDRRNWILGILKLKSTRSSCRLYMGARRKVAKMT